MSVYLRSMFTAVVAAFDDTDDNPLPPGSPPRCTLLNSTERRTVIMTTVYLLVQYDGPWFATQITLSATIGIFSFLLFSYCRTRYPLLFAPRTKLKGTL
jgi:calcium permeable stress-gated cation channel